MQHLAAIGPEATRLFRENDVVPSEVGLFDDSHAVRGEPLLGDASTDRVVEIAPPLPVGRDDISEAVVRIPGVAPCVRFRRQTLTLPQDQPTLCVVLVTHSAEHTYLGTDVLPAAERVGHRRIVAGGREGHVGDVPRRIVRVALGPSRGSDPGDATARIQIEPPVSIGVVGDADDVPIGPVRVGAVLQQPCLACRTRVRRGRPPKRLGRQLVIGVPLLLEDRTDADRRRDSRPMTSRANVIVWPTVCRAVGRPAGSRRQMDSAPAGVRRRTRRPSAS